MFSIMHMVGEIKYTVYFFSSFSGMLHPFTPTGALEFDGIHIGLEEYDSTPYVQGWYVDTDKGPRLEKLLKYELIGQEFKREFVKSNLPGVYYHYLEKNNHEWKVKQALTPQQVFNKERYLRYIINNEGKLESAYHIYSSLVGSYAYTYNEHGAMVNVESKAYETPTEIPDL